MTADACEEAAVRSVDLIYRSAAAGSSCWARNQHGHRRELPMARWMGGPETTPQDRLADEHVLGHCSSRPTLELGCGPGRFIASLQQRGWPALGVDSSAAAVEMTCRRGGTAIRRDLFAPLPAEGSWEQILLTDGNIGIGGNPVRTLRRAADLLAQSGIVIVEIDPPATAFCYELLRWETDQHLGHWFPWSRMGAGALGVIAHAAGFIVSHIVEIHGRVIAVLTAEDCGGVNR
jgi:SAM-dependent methyltransferase